MFIGHYAIALAAKRTATSANLGTLFLACQLSDLIWPSLVLVGIEEVRVDHSATVVTPLDFIHYPYSHSLATNLVFALLFGWMIRRKGHSVAAAVTCSLTVISHWFLDFLTHRADLPLFPGSNTFGLGLWNSVAGTLLIESSLFAIGIWLYNKTTNGSPRPRVFWSLIGFLVLIYAGNIFGPKPEIDTPAAAIAGPALAMWLLVWWAGVADRAKLK
jgi:membrane-bound metal-dependent hydrolase YbcI (DUF457 family)